jgi:uncharacterized membrane protein YphA (DoxX/SURF4 family)
MWSRVLAPGTELTYAFLRIVAGLMFGFHGLQKTFGVLTDRTPAVGTQIWLGGIIELGAGTAIAAGVLTSWAAFLASGTMAVAYVQYHWKLELGARFLPGVNKGGVGAALRRAVPVHRLSRRGPVEHRCAPEGPLKKGAFMKLEGSCHCQAVRFRVTSYTPHPYMVCYCSICRKTAGGHGGVICIMGQADTLDVDGRDHERVYRARIVEGMEGTVGELSPAERHFCERCGSFLWAFDPRWPQWVYPFASAVDTPLPRPPEHVHLMEEFAAPWVEIPHGPTDRHFARYPDEAIIDWHKRHGLYEGPA